GQRDRHDQVEQARPQQRHDDQPEDQRRKGQQHVHRLHHQHVHPTADVPGDEADRSADDQRQRDRADRHDQRDARTPDEARIDVAAELVGAEPVLGRGRTHLVDDVLL
ncbi:MAG: hypothetical protein ACK55I_36720, partial [bacterium]